MLDEDLFHQTRNAFHRFAVVKTDDSKTENYHDVEGLTGHSPTKVLHIQPHGFSSVPVKDAHLLGVNMGHNYDGMVLIGGEHPDHKPKSLGEGNTALYNAQGEIIRMVGKSSTWVTGILTIKCGGVTVVIDGNGLTVTGGDIINNGKHVGHTHGHVSAPPGGPGPPV